MRKQPVQKRAQLTIEAIFQAAAQLVEREGIGNLTTNKIAAKAGFSVGTLYQYFSSKNALFRAMVQYCRESVLRELSSFLYRVETRTELTDIEPEVFFRQYIQICIRGFAFGNSAAQSLNRLCWLVETPEETTQTLEIMVERLRACLKYIQHPNLSSMSVTRCYVLNRSLMGCLRSAALERVVVETPKEFEDVLVEMILGQLHFMTCSMSQAKQDTLSTASGALPQLPRITAPGA
jgi:AcrR family transcriptional regulator